MIELEASPSLSSLHSPLLPLLNWGQALAWEAYKPLLNRLLNDAETGNAGRPGN